MKASLRKITALVLAILMALTSGPLTAVAEIVSGSQTDASGGFSLRSVQPYAYTLHAVFMVDGAAVAAQYVLDGGTLNQPATPTKADHKFLGWYDVNGNAAAFGAQTVTADTTVTYTARFAPIYYIFFHDVESQSYRVIHTKGWATGDAAVSTDDVFPSASAEQRFSGWYYDEALTSAAPAQLADLTANVHLYAKVTDGHWLNFVTGESATAYAPVFYQTEDVTQNPGTPSRNGYTFTGWYADEGCTLPFSFGAVLTANTTIYAGWSQKTTANYTVIYWQQKVSDNKNATAKTYDYASSEVKTGNVGTALTNRNATTQNYTGFQYATYSVTDANGNPVTSIAADGSTVLNVYYDRLLITMNFYVYQWRAWSLSGEPYTGLHGQPLGMYGYVWPTDYIWYESYTGDTGTGVQMSFLDAFLYTTNNSQTQNYYARTSTSRRTVNHYKQNVDGSYPTTPTNSVGINGTAFTLTNKYDGFTLHHYTKDNETEPTTANPNTSSGDFEETLYVYYARNKLNLEFKNGNSAYYNGNPQAAETKEVLFEAPMSSYANTVPSRPSGIPDYYEWDGNWYADPQCTTVYNFGNNMPNANVAVYAKWYAPKRDVTISITYDTGVSTETVSVTAGDLVNLPVPVRDGYTFAGWLDVTDGGSKPFNADTVITRNTTLHAVWVAVGQYTVSYQDTHNSANNFADSKLYAPEAKADIMYPAATSYTDAGKTFYFHSWNTSADGSGTTYYPNGEMQVNADTILYAQYVEKEDQVTLTYHANYPNGTDATSARTLYINQPYTVEGGLFSFAGYAFKGWSTASGSSNSVNYSVGAKISLDSATGNDLYAVWEKTVFTVSYAYTGTVPANAPAVPGNANVTYNDPYTVAAAPALDGYTFDGWYKDGVKTTSFDMPASDVQLTGSWSIRSDLSYTVNYLEQGTNDVLADAKTVGSQTFGTPVTENAIDINGYDKVAPTSQTITIGTGENVINFYYTKRTDISYTVNYLEQGTNRVLADVKTVNNQTFGNSITETAIDINGYDKVAPTSQTITIGTGENVINFYYTKRTDLSYTVHYYWNGTTTSVKDDKTVGNQTFQSVATESPVAVDGYTPVSTEAKTVTIGTGENVIIFYYYKNVEITANSAEKTYNGQEQSVSGYTGAPADAQFSISVGAKGTNQGTYDASFAAGTEGMVDGTEKYIITKATDGKLTINKLALTLTGETASKTYTGSEQEITGITASGLVTGHNYTAIAYSAKGTLPGEYNGSFTGTAKIVDGSGSDVTDNYNITATPGKLTITNASLALTLKGESGTRAYNGVEQELTTYSVEGLLPGHTCAGISYAAKGTNAGDYVGVFTGELIIRDEKQNDVTNNYSVTKTPGTLTITPVKVTVKVNNAEKVYGENDPALSATVTGLVNNESETLIDYTLSRVAGENVGDYTVSASGSEAQGNYTVEYVSGTLTIKQRPLEITADSASKVYDGTALTKETYTLTNNTSLAFNDKISSITITGSQTDAGSSSNAASGAAIASESQADVTNNYTITYKPGTLTVTPVTDKVTVTITENSGEFTYDGTEKTVTGYGVSIDNELYTDADFTFSGTDSVSGTLAGTYNMELKASDFSNTSANFTNVEFVIVDGQLIINPVNTAIVITAGSLEKTYDGTALTYDHYTVTGTLVDGDAITDVVITGSQTDAGSSENIVTSYKIMRGGVDVTGSYNNVTKGEGSLLVRQRPVQITANTAGYTFDNTAKQAVGTDGKLYTVSAIAGNAGSGLVSGHQVTAAEVLYAGAASQTNVGEYDAVVTDGTVVIMNGDTNVTANYDISYENGKLTITSSSDWSLNVANGEKTYDGTPLSKTASATVTDGTTIYYSTDAGEEKTWSTTAPSITDAGSITVYVKATNSNYDDLTGSFTLTVNKRTVTLASETASKAYDGTALEKPTVTVSDPGFVAGEVSDIKATGSITDVGSVTNTITYTQNASFKAENYDISKTEGTLTITTISSAITITANSNSKTYDGTALTDSGYTVSGSDLIVDGDELVVVVAGSQTDAGSSANKVTSYKVMRGDSDVTANYTFAASVDGTLTVNKRTVTLTSETASKVYDGTALEKPTVTVSAPGFVAGEVSDIKATGSITDVGSVTNTITYTTNASFKDGNYTIVKNEGKLEINPLAVTVTVTGNTGTYAYDKTAHTVSGYTIDSTSDLYDADLENNYTFTKDGGASVTATNAGTYPMGLLVSQFANTNTNYTVTFEVTDGWLTITPIADTVTVTITEDSGSYVYDATAKSISGYTVATTNELYTTDDFAYVGDADKLTVSATNAGSYPMNLTAEDFSNTNANFANVTFVIVDGSLAIAKRPVTITANSATDYIYDGTQKQALENGKLYTVSAAGTDTGLVSGHTENVTVLYGNTSTAYAASQKNAGEYTAHISAATITASGTDVTDNYDITLTDGTLAISRKAITVTADDKTKVYGEEDPELTVTVSGLVTGESETLIAYTLSRAEGEDVGTYTITPAGISEPGNYSVTYETGDFEITKRSLTIVAASDSKTYDGDPLTNSGYSIKNGTSLRQGDSIDSVTVTGSQTEAGSSANIASSAVIKRGNDTVTANYDISYENGTLTVTSLDSVVVTITEHSGSYVYDGTEKTVSGYDVSISNPLYTEADFTFSGTDTVKGTAAGEYEMELAASDFTNTNANFGSVTFVIVDGTLTISKRPITIKANDNKGITYDGNAHGENGYTVTNAGVTDQGLATNHAISTLTIAGSQILVGLYAKELVPSGATIVDQSGTAVTGNYAITYVEGDLEIVNDVPVIPEKTTPDVESDYKLGDKIPFNIKVQNITNAELTNVTVTDPTATIVAGTGYTVSANVATIASIPAGGSVTVKAEHTVTSDDILAGTYGNTASITVNDKTVEADAETDKIDDVKATLDVAKTTTSTADGENGYALGSAIAYSITVTNTGNVPLYNVTLTDPLTGFTTTIAELAVGATSDAFTTSYTVTEADILAGSITNVVNAAAAEVTAPDGTKLNPADSASVTDPAEDLNTALSVTKTSDKTTVSLGDVITYTITVKHEGNVAYPNLVIEDELDGLTITNATSTNTLNTWTIDATNGTVSADQMTVGETVTITATYTVTSEDILKGYILNAVTASGDPIDNPKTEEPETPEGGDDTENGTDPVNTELSVKKTSSLPDGHETAALGDVITYTITVENKGNVPYSQVVISDPLEDLTITQVTSSKTGFTYTEEDNVVSIATMAVGEIVTITATYTVTEDDVLAGKVLNNVVANATQIVTPTPTPGPDGGDPTPTPKPLPTPGATDSVEDKTDPVDTELQLVKEEVSTPANGTAYALGETVEYKITVSNEGNVPFTNVDVNDPLTALDETIAELIVGGSQDYTTTYVITSDDILRGYVLNTATAVADPIENPEDPDNPLTPMARDEEEVATVAVDVSLDVTKTSDVAEGETVSLGETVTYTITVKNTGNVPYPNVQVKDPLAGLTIAESDDYTVSGDTVTIDELAVGATVTITATYVVTEADILAGSIVNAVAANAGPIVTPTPTPNPDGGDPTPTPRPLPTPSATDTVTDEPDDLDVTLKVTKTSDNQGEAVLGQTITYTITVEHQGNVAYPNLVISDPLDDLTIIGVTSSKQNSWTIDNTNGTVSADSMLVGEVVTITATYTVTSDDILAGSIVNTATAQGDPIDDPKDDEHPKTPGDSDTKTDTTEDVDVTLTMSKTSTLPDGKTAAGLGDTISYVITVKNDGNVPMTNLVVTDEKTNDTWRIALLDVGEAETFNTTYTVTSADILAGYVHNVVTAQGDSVTDPDKGEQPVEGRAEVEDDTEAINSSIGVSKVSQLPEGKTKASLGDVITYTITVVHQGNVPYPNVVISDQLSGLTITEAESDADTQWTIDAENGTVTAAEMAVGETLVITATYTVTENDVLVGFVKNHAVASGGNIVTPTPRPGEPEATPVPTPGAEDDEKNDTDPVDTTLVVTKVSDVQEGETVGLGETITYTITVKNDGNVPYTGIEVVDDLDGLTITDVTSTVTGEHWTIANGTVTIDAMAVGETVTITATYVVTDQDIMDKGEVTNKVKVTGGVATPVPGGPAPDPDATPTPTPKPPEGEDEITDETDDIDAVINVVKESDVADGVKVAPGDVIHYTITISNVGNVPFSGVAAMDELPGIVVEEGDGYTLRNDGSVYIGDLKQNESVLVKAHYTVLQEDILKGYVVNTVIATGDPIDNPKDPEDPVIPEGGDEEKDEVIDIDPTLTVTKTTTSTPHGTNGYDLGEAITYEMTVKNDGNIVMHNLTVTDPLTGDVWMIDELAIGESKTYTASHIVTSDDILAGKVVNTVYAAAESIPDPKNPGSVITPSGSASVTDIPEDIDVGVKVVKRSQGKPADGYYRVGETIKYQIKVTNEGNVPYERLEVFDELTGGFWTVYDLKVGETREFYTQYVVQEKDLVRGYVLNRAVVTGDPIPDPKNPDEPKVPTGEGIEIDYTNSAPMGAGIINMNVGDCFE